MDLQDGIAYARHLDRENKQSKRERFVIPNRDGAAALYFLGNSLGLQPANILQHIQRVLDTWASDGVEGFFRGDNPWLQFHDALSPALSRLVGAKTSEIVIMNGLTVNLHLLLSSFYQPAGARNKIICEAKAFPSDQYMLETHVRQRGFNPDEVIIEVASREGSAIIAEADILATIERYKDEVALVFWGGVNYYTGQVFNMKKITRAGHAAGALVGFDLAHAAGNVALQLHNWDVDFAAWCNYKYLNGGPGAVAAAFVHERRYQDASLQRLAGWWGYEKDARFQMRKGFVPVANAEGWALSTPSALLFAALAASLEIFSDVDMLDLSLQGKKMSGYLIALLEVINTKTDQPKIKVLTPAAEEERGCQVSMLLPDGGREIFESLSSTGVFADWREPDVIRVAPVPLYNTFEEIWLLAERIEVACKQTYS